MRDWARARELLVALQPLNRVHNGPGMVAAMEMIQDWLARHGFRGRARVLEYAAGSVHNWWRVPPRWYLHAFSLRDSRGHEIVNQDLHPLVVVPFSDSFTGRLTRAELLEHVHTRPDLPEAVACVLRPMYRHWQPGWGLALPHRTVDSLTDSHYEVRLETERRDEPMPVLEYTLAGRRGQCVQFAAHLDHPGQVNDSLSGVVGALATLGELEARFGETELTYSVLLGAEHVGSACYLHNEAEAVANLSHCIAPNMLGHEAPLALCLSKSASSLMDRALLQALRESGDEFVVGGWHEYPDCGDEISYDAPGLDIPASTVSRMGGRFALYHTSLDTLDELDMGCFAQAVDVMAAACGFMERNAAPMRRFVGNPALSNPDLDLYFEPVNLDNKLNPAVDTSIRDLETGAPTDLRQFQEFFLSNLEGHASLLDLALEFAVPFELVADYAEAFAAKGLVELRPVTREADCQPAITRMAHAGSGVRGLFGMGED